MTAIGAFLTVRAEPNPTAGGPAGTPAHVGASPLPRVVRTEARRLGRACLRPAGATACRVLAPGGLAFTATKGMGRAGAESAYPADRLRADAREVLWNLSTEAFHSVLDALETRVDTARPMDRATLLAALDVWCELHPLPANRQAADCVDARIKRHALRATLQAPALGLGRTPGHDWPRPWPCPDGRA